MEKPVLNVCGPRMIERLSTIWSDCVTHLKTALLEEYPISGYPLGVMEGAAHARGLGEYPFIPSSWIQLRLKASREWRSRRNRTYPIFASFTIVGLKV